ncbi:MAG: hypothetical protein O7A98_09550, partial [Acidobacteria bacterium]|nr:hypothetical protein [Acidobacteriota bacterium]
MAPRTPSLSNFLSLCLVLPGLILSAPCLAATDGSLSVEWVEKWRSDLHFVAEEMPKVHPNLFHTRDAAAFEADLDVLSERIASLAHHQIVVELQRLIARLEDGHTRLTLPLE